ncbi:ABC transporter substrate-binding protein [Gordonia sp. ABSL11-1]|uniref:ABC transporter substrate-binding protein n=1 Tax=Gordonia sp. ABSL11-1 TaxID=3053924 RepID=UPI002572792D|nr:ABC transporter substrate-binding protein [Gordonia sp. ABSL11-1]MDL9947541.1 ABC transporter substrate-binding protein [Gordonia sp. ABSL11-1]
MREQTGRRARRRPGLPVTVTVLGAVIVTLTGLLTACGDDGPPTIDYVVDGRISSYNANTVDGNADGVLMATTRLLPGFSYLGAQGQVAPDRDIGTVTAVPGTGLTLRYDFDPQARFSDGQALDCDDLVLAWAAMSGRFPGFRPATTAGYRDIDRVDCAAGDRSATVTFAQGRDYRDWLSLFGAGTLLPAHVVAREAGVAGVLDPVRAGNRAVTATIAKAWNSGFALTPGSVDETRFPSSGPYRIDGYSESGGLVLVPNDKWWGDAPRTQRIAIWGRGTDGAGKLSDGSFDIADVTGGLIGEDDIRPSGDAAVQPLPQPNRALAVEEVILAQRGVLGSLRARQALASCIPRDALARRFGQGAQVWNLRVLPPSDNLAGQLNGSFGRAYARPDLQRARALGGGGQSEAGSAPMRVRVGYLAPTTRRQQMVAAMAESCRPVGIDVVDAGAPDITPGALGRSVDALIVANGAGFAAAGAANPSRDAYQLRGGDPLNLGGFRSPEVTGAVDALVTSDLAADRLQLVRAIENAAWSALPSIPMFAAPRVQRWNGLVDNVVAGLGRNGTGWNMDRWTVRE